LKYLGKNLACSSTVLDPRTYKREPREARECFTIVLDEFADLGEIWPQLQLRGKLNEEGLNKLIRAAKHPRVKLKYWNTGLFQAPESEVDEGCLAGTPRPQNSDNDAFG
jgi:hypothetical protein